MLLNVGETKNCISPAGWSAGLSARLLVFPCEHEREGLEEDGVDRESSFGVEEGRV